MKKNNEKSIKAGDTVSLSIYREKRLEYAALHTAGHITVGILRIQHNYKYQVSANHFPKQSKVEFKLANAVNKESIESQTNQIIADAKKICEEYHENGVRCIADGL